MSFTLFCHSRRHQKSTLRAWQNRVSNTISGVLKIRIFFHMISEGGEASMMRASIEYYSVMNSCRSQRCTSQTFLMSIFSLVDVTYTVLSWTKLLFWPGPCMTKGCKYHNFGFLKHFQCLKLKSKVRRHNLHFFEKWKTTWTKPIFSSKIAI